MKRYAAIVISLFAVVGLVTGVFANIRRRQAMEIRFNKRDLPKHGVHIITSADAAFEVTASNYFKDESFESSKNLSPLSVFIENSGNRSVVAYMLVWQLVKANGQVLTNVTSYSEPDILMGDPIPTHPAFKHKQAIMPHTVKFFSWSAPIGPEGEEPLGGSNASQSGQHQMLGEADPTAIRAQLNAELSTATDVTVSLDGVFFNDGTFVGPNTTAFFERIQAIVNAKLDLRRDVAVASEQGKIGEVFEAIGAKSFAPDVMITSESSPEDYYKHYMKLFAREISDMHRAYGKERLGAYLVNLHKRPRPVLRKAQP